MDPQIALKIFMPAALFFMMLVMGLELTPEDFRRVFVNPRGVLTGVLGQILLLPTFAFALVIALPMPTELAIGLIILSACPGGAISNIITYLARADTALSISMTALSSLLNVITLPLLANLALHNFADGEYGEVKLPIAMTMGQLAVLTILPVVLGMWLKSKKGEGVSRVMPVVKQVASVVFVLVVVAVFASNWTLLAGSWRTAVMHAFIVGFASTFMGYGLARVMRLPHLQCLTISVEFCIQNVAMAALVAISLLGRQELGIFAGIYAIVCLVVILPMVSIFRSAGGDGGADKAA
ncbi:MAG: bile acid:sodium symporter [Myxococcales bacterium]|nr:bile acid:sodium symporter [Myxococcales bacterium]